MVMSDLHHLNVLKNDFENEKALNAKYSLRQFAKKLSLSPSGLSEILKRKKFISSKMASSIASSLKLVGSEKELFTLSCLIDRSKNSKIKNVAIKKFTELSARHKKSRFFDDKNLATVETWMQFAIMELITFKDFNHNLEWLAKKLKAHPAIVNASVENLIKLGWIINENNTYLPSFNYASSTDDNPSDPLKKYQKSVLKRAENALNEQHIQHREFQSAIFGFECSDENLVLAKAEIRRFIDEFSERFSGSENKNQVYHLL
jgi:uncharacterized protein (TIGR02147 family)